MVFMCILLEKIDGYNGKETHSNFTLYNKLLKLQKHLQLLRIEIRRRTTTQEGLNKFLELCPKILFSPSQEIFKEV